MKILSSILKSANVLNLALASLALVLAFFLVQFHFAGPVTPVLPAVKVPPPARDFQGARAELPSYLDYADMSDKNIFHPERKVLKGEEALRLRPEILLYGTLVTDGVKLACLEDKHTPLSTPGRGKRQLIVKEGGSVGGYLVKEVNKDGIVLVRGADRIVVGVYDGRKRRNAESAAAAEKKAAAKAGRTPAGRINTNKPGANPTGPAFSGL